MIRLAEDEALMLADVFSRFHGAFDLDYDMMAERYLLLNDLRSRGELDVRRLVGLLTLLVSHYELKRECEGL